MINILNARHAYPEPTGACIDRPNGTDNYTFLHFFQPVELMLGAQRLLCKPHATLIYAMHEPQYYRMVVPMTHDWFHFTLSDEDFSTLSIQPNLIYYPAYTAFITKIVREIEYECSSPRKDTPQLIDAKVRELFIKTVRASTGEMEPPTDKDTESVFRALRAQMFLNLSDAWCVERMARAVNLSPSRFYAVYKSVFHASPMDDLISARIDKAKDLLLSGELSVLEVAREVGYQTPAHFTRLFTRLVGMSPRAYREMMRHSH